MINVGQCPKCEKTISTVQVEDVRVDASITPAWKGFSFHCPWCRTILGVQINPLTLKQDIVKDLLKALGRQ